MHEGIHFICALYEIIKRYDKEEEVCTFGSFVTFRLDELFLYVNQAEKKFFLYDHQSYVEGFHSISVPLFFRHFRDYGVNEEFFFYNLVYDRRTKLNSIIFNEIATNFSPEYFEKAKAAFNGFMQFRSSNSHILSTDEKRVLYGQPPIITESTDDEKELNACIERAEALINRKINFDNL